MSFVSCYEKVDHERALRNVIGSYSARNIPEVSFGLVLIRRPSYLFYLIARLDYWRPDCAFACPCGTHQRQLLMGEHKTEIFPAPRASRHLHDVTVPF